MSSASSNPTARALPSKYVAVLFEGPWLFRQDPEDSQRILAVCPYVEAPEHICQVGLWNSETMSIQSPDGSGGPPDLLQEKEICRVDIPIPSSADSSDDLFDDAHSHYHFPYFASADPTTRLEYAPVGKMRQVSISMPSQLEVDGISASTLGGQNGPHISYSATDETYSYVTFAFIYKDADTAKVSINTNAVEPVTRTIGSTNAHLLFRVFSPVETMDSNGCSHDFCMENLHMATSFESLRKMVFASTKPPGDLAFHMYCLFGQSFPLGEKTVFTPLGKVFSGAELGISEPKNPLTHYNDLAACGQGGMAARSAVRSSSVPAGKEQS